MDINTSVHGRTLEKGKWTQGKGEKISRLFISGKGGDGAKQVSFSQEKGLQRVHSECYQTPDASF